MPARRALTWVDELELSEHDRRIAGWCWRRFRSACGSWRTFGVGTCPMNRGRRNGCRAGEAQRIRLATQIRSSLVGVLYILDEPSIGLHQRGHERLIRTARAPAGSPATRSFVVDTTRARCAAADHLLDMDPAPASTAGTWSRRHGGRVAK